MTQRISTQRRDISQHREAVIAKARLEVEREWAEKQAASDQDAAESRAIVAVARERRERLAALMEERDSERAD